jgi:uncharacterized protein (TIGR00251 family)
MTARLTVKVIPGASQTKIAGLLGDALKIRVQAQPEKGKANIAVLEILAKFLGVPVTNLSICTGHTSHTKVVEVEGISDAELARKLFDLAT